MMTLPGGRGRRTISLRKNLGRVPREFVLTVSFKTV